MYRPQLSRPRHIISLFSCLLVIGFCVVLNLFYSDGNVLAWDVFGYYLYLPLIFIYNDLGLENVQVIYDIIDQYHSTGTFYQASHIPSGDWVMKYSAGMAILYLPFFLIGHFVALITTYPADGFSAPYQVSILIGGILYALVGIFTLRCVLLKFFKDGIVALVLVTLYFGTNYFFQSSLHGSNAMPHNWLFTLYALILFLTIKWHEEHRTKYIVLLAIVCGINILARPSEIVCLLVPLLWGITDRTSLRIRFSLLWQKRMQIILFALILLAIGSIQFIYWKIFTGKFLYYSYGSNAGEGFEFLSPHIAQVLFSFRKGWLVYTPVVIFAIFGIFYLYKKQRILFLPILVFTLLNLYLVSSWSNWWYAESLGSRALVQSLAILAIPFAAFYEHTLRKGTITRPIVLIILFLFIALNLFQSWQFDKGIIHGSRMTRAYYMATLGRLEVSTEDRKLLLVDRSSRNAEEFKDEHLYNSRTLDLIDMESIESDGISTDQSYSGEKSFLININHANTPSFESRYSHITDHYYAWLRVSVMVYPTTPISENPASLVLTFDHNGYAYKFRSLNLETMDLKTNEWNKVSFDYMTPEVRNVNDKFKTFVWLRGEEPIYIDDLKVEVFEPIER